MQYATLLTVVMIIINNLKLYFLLTVLKLKYYNIILHCVYYNINIT